MAIDSACFTVRHGEPLLWAQFYWFRERREDGAVVYRVMMDAKLLGIVERRRGGRSWVATLDGRVIVGSLPQRADVFRELVRCHLVAAGKLPGDSR